MILAVLMLMTLTVDARISHYRCGPNQHYSNCGTNCPATCSNPNPQFCNYACNIKQHCFCNEGYVQRSETDLTCIPVEKCPEKQCGPNQVYSECGTNCPANCDDQKPEMCNFACNIHQHCFCKPGFVELSETDKTCVPVDSCPPHRCGPNQHYSDCGTNCPATCDNPNPQFCNLACNIKQRCFCNEGYVQRSETDLTCIPVEKCPEKKCGLNQVYNECGTNCPANCEDQKPEFCNLACNIHQHCFCKPGFVELSETDKTCVPVDSCPQNQCGPNQVYNECGTNCPANCEDQKPMCNFACNIHQHCFCKPGFVELSETDKTCVPVDSCPHHRCGPNQHYSDCGTNCPATCANPNPQFCNLACNIKQRCFCNEGYVQRSETDLTCIPVEKCPEKKCGPNQIYNECGTNCPANCGDQKPEFCNLACNIHQHCFCKPGFVELSETDKTCVPVDSCPQNQCGPNQVYNECGTNCPANCEDQKPMCNFACNIHQHCFCKPGFVELNETDKTCVPVDSCPR